MIAEAKFPTVTVQVARCTACGHAWLIESSRTPARCPSRACRSSRWNQDSAPASPARPSPSRPKPTTSLNATAPTSPGIGEISQPTTPAVAPTGKRCAHGLVYHPDCTEY